MAKGLFTQGVCILLRENVSIEEVEQRLSYFELVGRHESIEDDDAPETLVYKYQEEQGGHLLVTPSRTPWPDDMGEPDESPERFVAWSLGQFGPLAFPGCLERASEQAFDWEGRTDLIKQHTGHIRLLISYVLGGDEVEDEADEETALVPDDYDSLDELHFVTRAATALLELPQAICYFNPGGEVIMDATALRQGLNHAWCLDLPPLDMWTNVRFFKADEAWTLMDTVGNGQYDLPDLEAVYRAEQFEPTEVEQFLRNATLYMLMNDEEVEEGDTADGPGEISWLAMECNEALSDPPRPTIRWVPQNGESPPEELLFRGEMLDDFDEDELDDDELDDEHDDGLDDELEDDPFGGDPFA